VSDDALLRTLEQRVRTLVDAALRAIPAQVGGHLTAQLNAQPDASGAQIVSAPEVHDALVTALDAARGKAEAAIRAGFKAAAQAGIGRAGAQARDLGFDAGSITAPTATLDAILRDLQTAFDTARLDMLDTVRAGLDDAAGSDPAARVLIARGALERARRRLSVRASAAAAVAVHRGYTDGQSSVHDALKAAHPYLRLTKRWEVRSATPCPACAALHGTTVDLDAQFDATAGRTADYSPPRVWQDLHGPPRHPNCRCRLVLDPSEASTALRHQAAQPTPGRAAHLAAADIRRMPEAQYQALSTFLAAAVARLKALLKDIGRGH